MRIFLRGTRLFMYVEADDLFVPERDFPKSQASPRVQEWEALMKALQARPPEADPNEWWATMDLVFDLNCPQHQPAARQ
jgi:L-rhamnose mutarotase